MKIFKFTGLALMLLMGYNSQGQELFVGKKVCDVQKINMLTHYLYKGDKVVMDLKTTNSKPMRTISFNVGDGNLAMFRTGNPSSYTRGQILKEWEKPVAIRDTFEIPEDNAYFFFLEPPLIGARTLDISYTRIPAPGNEGKLLTYVWKTEDGKEIPVPKRPEEKPVEKKPVQQEVAVSGSRDKTGYVTLDGDDILQGNLVIGDLRTTIHDSYQNVVGNVTSKVYSVSGKHIATIKIPAMGRYSIRKVNVYLPSDLSKPVHSFDEMDSQHRRILRKAAAWLVENGYL